MSGNSAWKILWGTLIAAISGCTVGPNYQPPTMALPATFSAMATTQPGGASTKPADTSPPVDVTHWWRSLNDPELDSLVDRAVQSNLDLKMALMRLQQSRAQEYVVSGGTLPYIDASGTAARGSGNNSTKGRIGPPLNAAANTSGLSEITQVVGFDAGWEIDLFGRFRRQLEAAAADTQAAAEARNAVLITLISDVARAYVDLRTAQLRLGIAQASIATSGNTLDVVQQRFTRGLTNELDVALARREKATEQATLAPLGVEITQAQYRLAVLLGQTPESLNEELKNTAPLPDPQMKVISGLPVDLLRRRPDIRQAERRLAAENARIGVATADLFPRVAITAGFGLQGQGLGRTPTSDSMIWSVGPTAIMPLLDFGRIDGMIMLEDIHTKELFYNYQRTVLAAIEEVDDAVSSYAAQRDRLDRLSEAVAAGQRAVTIANGRYERGLIDFLNVLDAQRQLYALQDQYTRAQQTVAVQYVSLYKALGGGWETYQNIPPLRHPMPAVIAAGVRALGQNPAPEEKTEASASPLLKAERGSD